ncbi:MAG: polymer-forming cytoskeletal protein [Candidatus Cloacimonetes bacterium]|nr:polymer-forming cytoskeletal protein [Candidatus Cloacimonadota bacterium]MBS3767478.1 polymer-forming cytoskeletal protein [Candidatus Cloacimonadota bacterium]
MKKKKNKNLDALIGQDTHIKGEIETSDSIRIDGSVDGNITVQGYIVVGKGAKVKGDIKAEAATILGKVTGNIVAEKELQVSKESVIIGDITTKNLIIESGAVFDGKCNMYDKNAKQKG